MIGRRGASSWRLTVRGTPAHSSQIFRSDIGFGAGFEVARVLDGFRQKLAGEPHLTLNPGLVLGGTEVEHEPARNAGTAFGKNNVIAERAVVSGDLRVLSLDQLARARAAMRAVVAAPLPGTSGEITFEDGNPPLAPSAGNARLLAMYDEASRSLGDGPIVAADPDKAGAADVTFIADRVPMILDGIGLRGDGGHTPQETADLASLPVQTRRFAVLLHRLARR